MSRKTGIDQVRAMGVCLFNEARYFESHEAFEDAWRLSTGADRALYQGLVQACAGLLKHQQGRRAGARTLLAKSLANLARAGGHGWPELDLAGLVAQLTTTAQSLDQDTPCSSPRISLSTSR